MVGRVSFCNIGRNMTDKVMSTYRSGEKKEPKKNEEAFYLLRWIDHSVTIIANLFFLRAQVWSPGLCVRYRLHPYMKAIFVVITISTKIPSLSLSLSLLCVAVTSYDPLRIYIFKEGMLSHRQSQPCEPSSHGNKTLPPSLGLARFCTKTFTLDPELL